MNKTKSDKAKKSYLLVGIISSLSVLFVFKYFNFINETGAAALTLFGLTVTPVNINVLLPVGISFYTFQTLSYTIDVYRNQTEPEDNFGIFALYVSFFPQLVAGPIERSTNLLPQFYKKHKFDGNSFREGFLLMLWGLFKKMIIADRLAIFVNNAYSGADSHPGWVLLIATLFFSIQIYCDFSGYSDIAIGAAQCMGFKLMVNFNRPYLASSIKEFWKRWHISLSTWFRDYLYIPLGGNRVKKPRQIFNLIITFTISGLWHGANMTFIAWGLFNALFQVAENATSKIRDRIWSAFKLSTSSIRKVFGWFITFSIVTMLWVVFRAETISKAIYIYKSMAKSILLGSQTGDASLFSQYVFTLGLNKPQFTAGVIAIFILFFVDIVQTKVNIKEYMRKKNFIVWWLVIISMIIMILVFGIYGDLTPQQFIYFQF